ncbi:MAG: TetR/AcrR family transcriptional regulator [Bacteroidota bacterium]
MIQQKELDREILVGLTRVFRSKGYEGASLKELAEATGLKKASLYHRFPNGKQEMATAVLAYIDNRVAETIFQALSDEKNTPQVRLKTGLDHIKTLYNNGKETCILRALSMRTGLDLFEAQVNNGMKKWIDAFHKIGLALELSPSEAEKNALQTLVEIQGSLIVTKGLDDTNVFENTLKRIENRYLEK